MDTATPTPAAAVTHPPPPPPPPPPNSTTVSPQQQQQQQQQDQRRRFPIQPPTLSTTALPGQRHAHLNSVTPASAVTGVLPFSPSVSSNLPTPLARDVSPMVTRSGSSTVLSYNPSDWARQGSGASSYVGHAAAAARRRAQGTQNVSGMEAAMPSPPPPYSPSPVSSVAQSRLARTSPHYSTFSSNASPVANNTSEYSTPTSAATTVSSGGFPSHRQTHPSSTVPTSQTDVSPVFPPPPPSTAPRDRSTSRSRFGLSALASRARGTDNTSPGNAMDVLQQQTAEAIARAPSYPPSAFAFSVQAPSARRAASAGAIRPSSSNASHGDYSSSPQSQDLPGASYGFALPGPPPGPPPSTSRSQSASRAAERLTETAASHSALPLRSITRGTVLGPVPPTPANWTDGDEQPFFGTSAAVQPSSARLPPAPRELSTNRSIRERRSEARARAGRSTSREPHTAVETTSNPWSDEASAVPADLVLSSNRSALGRRRHVSKSKTSPLFHSPESPHSQRVRSESHVASLEVGPAALSAPVGPPKLPAATPTPPFSGSDASKAQVNLGKTPIHGKARALPTPEASQDFARAPGSSPPSTHPRPDSWTSLNHPVAGDFAQASMNRFRAFIEAETAAQDDQTRLELFADFIVTESRLRRDLYAAAFDSMGSDVLDLTRDLWRSMSAAKRAKTPTPLSAGLGSAAPTPTHLDRADTRTPIESSVGGSAPASALSTPRTSQDSESASAGSGRDRANSTRQNAYQPALSPILSMALSTVASDEDSRGRAPSRWWEASNDGLSIGEGRKLERSKRESKYMGVARETLQKDFGTQLPSSAFPTSAGPSNSYYDLGPDEYPAEKVGWHDEAAAATPQPGRAARQPARASKTKLDVSRLITLPPPFPRHYPAVSNNHPDLSSLRQSLRAISDREPLNQIRESYNVPKFSPDDIRSSMDACRRQARRDIHEQVSHGKMSFADAAKAEDGFEEAETQKHRDAVQRDFDGFQARVMSPLSSSYSERINAAASGIDALRESLSDEARSRDPTLTQEEGDEKPELLEKLRLLKWMFEARELLHKEMYLLESESDEMYKRVILTPYEISGAQDKVAEVKSFFEKDRCDRRATREKKALRRSESFLQLIEQHVSRGVELQLSAFWDIAPGLLAVVQHVPDNLSSFDVLIPADEYEENPGYHEHPLQYLFSLVSHAEKSAYQFIESQTNLLCLLHEVKTGVMLAGCKLLEAEREQAGEDRAALAAEMEAVRRDEDARLTSDLKEKVDIVDDQWKEALGSKLAQCKGRVKAFLVRTGGWIDELDE